MVSTNLEHLYDFSFENVYNSVFVSIKEIISVSDELLKLRLEWMN